MLKNIYLNPTSAIDTEGTTGGAIPAAAPVNTVTPPQPLDTSIGIVDLEKEFDVVPDAPVKKDDPAAKAADIIDKAEEPVIDDKKPVVPTEPAKPAADVVPPAQQTTAAPATNGRDYSIFRPEEAEILKKSPNQVYEFAKTILPKLYTEANKAKQLEAELNEARKGAVPQQWHEHPQAFALHPKFQEIRKTLSRAEFEASHYNEQAVAVENGAAEYSVVKHYDENGNPVMETFKVTPEQQTRVKNALLQTALSVANVRAQKQAEANEFAGSFKQRFEGLVGEMKKAESHHFPFFDETPEKPLPEESKNALKAVSELVPAEFKNHPLASFITKSGALNILLLNRLKQFETQMQQKQTAAQDAKLAGPSGSELSGAGTTGKSNIIDSEKEFGD